MRRRSNKSTAPFALVMLLLGAAFVGALFAQGVQKQEPKLAACYVRQLHGQTGGGVSLQQGSATLIRFQGVPGVYAITAYHVTEGMGGVKSAELYVPDAGSYPVSVPYFDTALDTSLLRVEKAAPELETRALVLESLTVGDCLPQGELVTYNDAQKGGAIATAEKRFAPKEVVQLPVAVQLPVQQLSAPIFLRGAQLQEGQSGALLYEFGQPVGLASANAKVNGKKGHLMVPFNRIQSSLAWYAKSEKERQLAARE